MAPRALNGRDSFATGTLATCAAAHPSTSNIAVAAVTFDLPSATTVGSCRRLWWESERRGLSGVRVRPPTCAKPDRAALPVDMSSLGPSRVEPDPIEEGADLRIRPCFWFPNTLRSGGPQPPRFMQPTILITLKRLRGLWAFPSTPRAGVDRRLGAVAAVSDQAQVGRAGDAPQRRRPVPTLAPYAGHPAPPDTASCVGPAAPHEMARVRSSGSAALHPAYDLDHFRAPVHLRW